MQDRLKNKSAELSGGQRQRVAIARVYAEIGLPYPYEAQGAHGVDRYPGGVWYLPDSFCGVFAASAAEASRASIIGNFTGDFIVYSSRSKELPSPFAFNTPLPNIKNPEELSAVLDTMDGVEAHSFYAQNYGLSRLSGTARKSTCPSSFMLSTQARTAGYSRMSR